MLSFHPNPKATAREKLLEKRIENLQEHIRRLENAAGRVAERMNAEKHSSVMVLPVTYTFKSLKLLCRTSSTTKTLNSCSPHSDRLKFWFDVIAIDDRIVADLSHRLD